MFYNTCYVFMASMRTFVIKLLWCTCQLRLWAGR